MDRFVKVGLAASSESVRRKKNLEILSAFALPMLMPIMSNCGHVLSVMVHKQDVVGLLPPKLKAVIERGNVTMCFVVMSYVRVTT